MASRLAGHGLQLLGYTLVFLGLAVVAAVLFLAGRSPATPMGMFVLAAMALGSPLMIAGGRINSRGRGIVLGQTPGQAARDYRESTTLLAVYLGFLGLHGVLVAAPLFVRASGLVPLGDTLIKVWVIGGMLILCAGRDWISRPLWRRIERRVTAHNIPPMSMGSDYASPPSVVRSSGRDNCISG